MMRAPVLPPAALPLALALTLCGCASTLSGVGGSDGYACKVPEGAMCTSVSGVYANSTQGMPRSVPLPAVKAPTTAPATQAATAPAVYGAASIASGAPAVRPGESIRSNPRVLRVWIAPWEDSDGDLHEESLVHVLVDTGRWLIEHVRPAVRSRVDGVAPPVSPSPQTSPIPTPGESPPPPAQFPLAPRNPSPVGLSSSGTLSDAVTSPQEQ